MSSERSAEKKGRSRNQSRAAQGLRSIRNRLFLPWFLKKMQRLKIGGVSGGNRVTLITEGDRFFTEIITEIKRARSSINLETYIFNSDDLGWTIAELLAKKAAAGIEVNVVYDAVGCLTTSPALFDLMRGEGAEVLEYNPVAPWKHYLSINNRNHRKLLVVDGATAFVGGMNIGQEYAGKQYRGNRWRDTHLKITGPAVRDMQFCFMETWYRLGGAFMDNRRHFPAVREAGDKLVMILSSKSRRNIRPIRESYVSAINYARETIHIANAYFIPDAAIYRALIKAAARGVDVRLLLPEKNDIPVVKYASRYLYKKFLKCGIRIFEYLPTVLHAKTAVIDNIWSTVGSTNLDRRSFNMNLEINAVVLDQKFGERMDRVFREDCKKSRELTLEHWERRSLLEFFLEWLCYRFRKLL